MVPWWAAHATAIGVLIAAVVIVATVLATLWLGGRRARAQADERRRALGEARTQLRGGDEDHIVCLRGALVVREGGCARFEGGADDAAAATLEISAARTWYEAPEIESSSHRRAQDLALRLDGAEIDLEGPLNIWVGSREVWPGKGVELLDEATALAIASESGFDPRKFDGFPVFRSIVDGEEVMVVGKLMRDRSHEARVAGYRETAGRWRLTPRGSDGIVTAAVAAPKIVSRRHLLLAGPSLVVGAAIVAYAGLFVAVDDDDLVGACDASCALDGRCDPQVRFGLLGTAISCRGSVPRPCARMRVCHHEGLCHEQGGRCVARDREDCERTPGCRNEGRCTPIDGVCAVGDDADCHGTLVCREHFACTAGASDETRICRVGSTADCRKTSDCKVRGLCTWVDDHCEAASDEDCRSTQYCQTDGLCSFDPERRVCFARTDTDCSASTACALQQRCYAVTDICRQERERE